MSITHNGEFAAGCGGQAGIPPQRQLLAAGHRPALAFHTERASEKKSTCEDSAGKGQVWQSLCAPKCSKERLGKS